MFSASCIISYNYQSLLIPASHWYNVIEILMCPSMYCRYKILFLDVLFPLNVNKIIFVDADQVCEMFLLILSADMWCFG